MTGGFEDDINEEVVEPETEGEGVTIDDFVALMTMPSAFIFMPCREIWPGSNVNLRLPRVIVLDKSGRPKRDTKGKFVTVSPTKWLAENRSVEQMTWCPGFPTIIPDRLMVSGGWIERAGVCSFNLYRPPRLVLGDPAQAGLWLEHFHKIYPDNAAHCIRWLAHRIQRSAEKPNHALVLGGEQGIGKDTLLEPIRYAVGPWNFQDVSPGHMLGRFNSYAKSVVLRVNEARDLGEFDRFKFYDHIKVYAASPPESLRVDEKHLKEYYVLNCLGLLITTNHKTDGIYLPPGDRRHYVAWSRLTKEEFPDNYWNELWGWYQRGGIGHVAAYLTELDLTDFDAKAPPPKTTAFWDIVLANAAPEDAELADLLDKMGNPKVVSLAELLEASAGAEAADWLLERRNRRTIPHRMERCGYTPSRNPNATDGLWKLNDRRQVVYARADLELEEQFAAINERCGEGQPRGR
jgi:hypothetical protein